MSLREMGELFGGAGYTAVAQMIGRTRDKDQKGALSFKLTDLMRQCVSEDPTPGAPIDTAAAMGSDLKGVLPKSG